MKTSILTVAFMFLLNTCLAQPIPPDSLYLGQTPPGYNPMIFTLPINGVMRPIERITISNDGKEIYFGQINSYPASLMKIYCYKYSGSCWQPPVEINSGFIAPALSPNDSILYMQLQETYDVARVYYSVRTGNGWSVPVRLFGFNQQSHYTQKTSLNNYYTSTNFPGSSLRDVSRIIISGADTSVVSLGLPISTELDESDFFIARDESYIIHARHTASIAGDLLISYKKNNGSWTNSKSLGPHINMPSPTWEYGPFVTQDNRYLFFTRGGNAWNSYYTYWVKIDNIIDSLKHTNFVPYVRNIMPNQTDTAGTPYSYTFPDTAFVDDDGNNTLSYSAALSSGNPLPSWLNFDPGTRTFWSTSTTAGTLSIKVTASDTANSTASTTFTIDVAQQIGIEPINEQIPTELKLLQNYPNPFNPSTSITFDIPKASNVRLVVYDINGREIQTLVNEMLRAGSYKVSLNGENLSSGIYFYTLTTNNFTQTKKMILLK